MGLGLIAASIFTAGVAAFIVLLTLGVCSLFGVVSVPFIYNEKLIGLHRRIDRVESRLEYMNEPEFKEYAKAPPPF